MDRYGSIASAGSSSDSARPGGDSKKHPQRSMDTEIAHLISSAFQSLSTPTNIVDQHRRRGGSGKTSYTQRPATGSRTTRRPGSRKPTAVSRVFGIGELLTSVSESLTPLELADVREVSKSWCKTATGLCIKKGGVAYTPAELRSLSAEGGAETGFRNCVTRLRFPFDTRTISARDAVPKFPFSEWRDTRGFLPRLEDITGISYVNEGLERRKPWGSIVVTLGQGSHSQATYDCPLEGNLEGVKNLSTMPRLDRELPPGTIVRQRLAERFSTNRATAEEKLRKAYPIPPLSRASLSTNGNSMSDADLTGCMRTLNTLHQKANGKRISSVALKFDDPDKLPFDFIRTMSRLQPFGSYDRRLHHRAEPWSGPGTRNASTIVLDKALAPRLTECLTSQAFFNQAQGLETLRASVKGDSVEGVSPLSRQPSVNFPPSLRSVILDLSRDDLNSSDRLISPADLSRYIERCDPNGAVRVDVDCTEYKHSTALGVYKSELDQCETARTGRQRGSDPFA